MTDPLHAERCDLLSCPFCGGDPMTEFAQTPEGDGAYFVHCQNDGCPAWPNTQGCTEAEAIAAWNTRTPTEAASLVDEDETYQIGVRDGRCEALAEIDRLTGGDGEYFASTLGDDCRDEDAMRDKIVERFAEAASRQEVERLREALERIAGQHGPYSHPFPEGGEGYAAWAVMEARAALTASEEGEA